MVYLSQKRLIVSKLKPRKGKDIKWIMIEIFWDENTVYVVYDMFSISIHSILRCNNPFLGFLIFGF